MDKQYICSLIDAKKEDIKKRVFALEKKTMDESLSDLDTILYIVEII
ncbi:MAG: hypothetical protein PF518_10165 [Spirochaetaceae bacterium]|jgi:hypothetical protein|nr:hypothetical protein [Spirochaetaceae bacterium]